MPGVNGDPRHLARHALRLEECICHDEVSHGARMNAVRPNDRECGIARLFALVDRIHHFPKLHESGVVLLRPASDLFRALAERAIAAQADIRVGLRQLRRLVVNRRRDQDHPRAAFLKRDNEPLHVRVVSIERGLAALLELRAGFALAVVVAAHIVHPEHDRGHGGFVAEDVDIQAKCLVRHDAARAVAADAAIPILDGPIRKARGVEERNHRMIRPAVRDAIANVADGVASLERFGGTEVFNGSRRSEEGKECESDPDGADREAIFHREVFV